jgi:hypothetical protein
MNCCVKCETFRILLTYQKITNPQKLGQKKEIEGEIRSISKTIKKKRGDLNSKHNEEI